VADLKETIRQFLDDIAKDELEERVVEYVIREVGNGRKLEDALHDPYVKNRLNDEKLAGVLENPDVIAALEKSITAAFKAKDFGFAD
jgi:hypothetical protein